MYFSFLSMPLVRGKCNVHFELILDTLGRFLERWKILCTFYIDFNYPRQNFRDKILTTFVIILNFEISL